MYGQRHESKEVCRKWFARDVCTFNIVKLTSAELECILNTRVLRRKDLHMWIRHIYVSMCEKNKHEQWPLKNPTHMRFQESS